MWQCTTTPLFFRLREHNIWWKTPPNKRMSWLQHIQLGCVNLILWKSIKLAKQGISLKTVSFIIWASFIVRPNLIAKPNNQRFTKFCLHETCEFLWFLWEWLYLQFHKYAHGLCEITDFCCSSIFSPGIVSYPKLFCPNISAESLNLE